jgi:(S)-3,5-dihydroxyphenylglycine transaminase
MEVARDSLHLSVTDPVSASMNFLNEVSSRFPDAISLAAGRPHESFHDIGAVERHLHSYLAYRAGHGVTETGLRTLLMQYGRTNGQIADLISRMLERDEGIVVPPEAIMVTAGAQEAMVIVLRGLCARPGDVILAAEPCYVGITGAARILGIEVVPVPEGPDGIDPDGVIAAAASVRTSGREPKALYVVPNFANPSGVSLATPVRRRLIDAAREARVLILEDDPYGLFGLDDEPRPTLKSLDADGQVIYIGSFAKSAFPGARVGYLVADQVVVGDEKTLLADELSTIKSMLTVNTSPIAQAVIGGLLVESEFSLRRANRAKIDFYRTNLITLEASLSRHFTSGRVTWNSPAGGFFMMMDVPVRADESLLEISARSYGVLWTPMSFFYLHGAGSHSIRLSCSALEPGQIDEGVRRLAALIADTAPDDGRPGPGSSH